MCSHIHKEFRLWLWDSHLNLKVCFCQFILWKNMHMRHVYSFIHNWYHWQADRTALKLSATKIKLSHWSTVHSIHLWLADKSQTNLCVVFFHLNILWKSKTLPIGKMLTVCGASRHFSTLISAENFTGDPRGISAHESSPRLKQYVQPTPANLPVST